MFATGVVLEAEDHGTMWSLTYSKDGNGLETVYFAHRPFGDFYEGATGRSFFEDYAFGAGREYVSRKLRGRRVRVDGEFPEQTVMLDD